MAKRLYPNSEIKGSSGFKMHRMYLTGHNDLHYAHVADRVSKLKRELFSVFTECSWCISERADGPNYSDPDEDRRRQQWVYIGFKNDEDILFFKLKYGDVSRTITWPTEMRFFLVEVDEKA